MKELVKNSNKRRVAKPAKIVAPKTQKKGPVIWAIDSAQITEDQAARMNYEFKALGVDGEVIPTSVYSSYDLGWLIPTDPKIKQKTLNEMGERVKQKWDRLAIKHEKSGFLLSDSYSRRDKVNKLVQFARAQKAQMIAVEAVGRPSRQMTGIGSFAETLLAVSTIPVYIVGPQVQQYKPVSKILFTTDLSDESKEIFKKVVAFAKKFGAEIALYHYLDLESGPLAFGIPWGYEVKWLDEYWQFQEESQKKEAAKWARLAEAKGVTCRMICDRKLGGLRERILEVTEEEKADLVAVGIKRGPSSQVILGGTIRHLLLKSKCPVLAIHTEEKSLQ